ncbi:hypothetical protein GJ496_005113 [Pomphorhynchus laevis]|nr:hypothetical protein GJ496_005113 [Pomphorhynchus laevis]
MAEYLASIFGTEKDKVNCSFYFKIGACRHGEKCSRVHNKPAFSQTVVMKNLYLNPRHTNRISGKPLNEDMSEEDEQHHFNEFYEEVWTELESKYGDIEELNVCDNLGEHLVGNIYVKFRREEDAEKAVNDLNNRWFDGKPIYAELSPVTDFKEASCRKFEIGDCKRGGFCNFMHIKSVSTDVRRKLTKSKRRRSRSRSARPRRRM